MTTTSMEAPLGWLARLGMGLVSTFAQYGDWAAAGPSGGYQTQGAAQGSAYAKPGETAQESGKRPPFPQPACCGVFFPNGPFCDYPGSDPSRYTCPPGSNRHWWFCPTTNAYGACAECTTSNIDCFRGEFKCSTWWYV